MKEYKLSELINATFDKYRELGYELNGLRDSTIAKPNYRNLELYVSRGWKNGIENSINATWDEYGDKIGKIIDFFVEHEIISPKNHYHLDITAGNEYNKYDEFEIIDLDKWNYYCNLLKSNEFIHNSDLFYFKNNIFENDYDKRELYLSNNYIRAYNFIPLVQNTKYFSPNEVFEFKCDKPYQIQYKNPDAKEISIKQMDEFLHNFTFYDNGMNDYLRSLLESNNGKDFDIYSNLDNYKVDSKAKTLSYKLLKK